MTAAEDRFEAEVNAATTAIHEQRWAEAGSLWEGCAGFAEERNAWAPAAACWEQSGEAWRRADEVLRAEHALKQALSQPSAPVDIGAVQTKLAAVLGERGAGREALAMASEAMRTGSGPSLPAAIDTWIGLQQGFGGKADQRVGLQRLSEVIGAGAMAVRFRQGQIHRLDGKLDSAVMAFEGVVLGLDGVTGAEAGVAAAKMELAEVGLLCGAFEEAVSTYEAGRLLHQHAGRVSLMWRCEVGRIRATVAAGLPVMAPGLKDALNWSQQRGLVLLTIDLQQALALSLVGRSDAGARLGLKDAYTAAMSIGARSRAGRTRLLMGQLLSGDDAERHVWCSEAADLLRDNIPLRDAARVASSLLA